MSSTYPAYGVSYHMKAWQATGRKRPVCPTSDAMIKAMTEKLNNAYPQEAYSRKYPWREMMAERMFINPDQVSRIAHNLNHTEALRKEFMEKGEVLLSEAGV